MPVATTTVGQEAEGSDSELGGDDTISLDTKLVFENPDGSAGYISFQDLLAFLGFNISDLVTLAALTPARPEGYFVTDARRENFVSGVTFSEADGDGSGHLVWYDSNFRGFPDGSFSINTP